MISRYINLLSELNHNSYISIGKNCATEVIKFYDGNLFSCFHRAFITALFQTAHKRYLNDIRHLLNMTMKLNINPHDDFLVIEQHILNMICFTSIFFLVIDFINFSSHFAALTKHFLLFLFL
jgi:hypothetical protein